MSKSDSTIVHASSLNLAASCLNLVKAIADSSLQGNAIAVATRTFFAWLVKEDIEESHYDIWANKTAGLATVNDAGLMMIQDVKKCTPKKTVAGIPVSFTGSVGRAMAYEPDHQYLVTTVAILMSFHDVNFVVKALTNMTFDYGGHSQGISYRYDVSKAFVARTMEKVVHSIALNVVNSGYTATDLPESLLTHYKNDIVDKDTFAAVVMALQPKEDTGTGSIHDILFDCDTLYGDITCWVLSHFQGTFQVSVSGEVVYSSCLGPEQRKLIMAVKLSPSAQSDSPRVRGDPFIRISIGSNGILDVGLHTWPNNARGPCPSRRFALYDTNHILRLPAETLSLNQHEVYNITLAARSTAKWLFNLPLKREDSLNFPNLSVGPMSLGASDKSPKLGDFLARWPGIFRLCGSQPEENMVAFKPPTSRNINNRLGVYSHNGSVAISSNYEAQEEEEGLIGLDLIRACFPKIQDLLTVLQQRCDCLSCSRKDPSATGKSGCLREAAMTLHSTLLANAIADGFGASDASGMVDNRDISHEIEMLLVDLIHRGTVSWNRWFALAAAVFLGCVPPNHHIDVEEGAGAMLAVQFGSQVVAARWANFHENLQIDGLFGFESVAGQIVGISSEEAIVQAEETMERPNSTNSTLEGEGWVFDEDEDNGDDPTRQEEIADDLTADECIPVVGRYIFKSTRPRSYRLITLFQTEKYHRYINPADAVRSIINSHQPTCSHRPSSTKDTERVLATKKTVVSWSLENLLGSWGTTNDPLDRTNPSSAIARTYLTKTLDSELKVNIALGLSPLGCSIRNPKKCCLRCALERCKRDHDDNSRSGQGFYRVINQMTKPQATRFISRVSRKYLED